MAKVPASERTVLIVDDDESVLTLLEILVHRDGFHLLTAANGERALELFKAGPHAVLLDLGLPGTTDGFEVLEVIRKFPAAPAVIIVTGHAKTPELEALNLVPCVKGILSKPFRQEELLKALHAALGTEACRRKPAAAPDATAN